MEDADHIVKFPAVRKRVLMVAPLVFGAAALCYWAIAPHVGYRRAMQCLENTMEQMTDELAMVHDSRDEKFSRLRAMRSELAALQEGLFTSDEFRLFVHDLQMLAEEAGCAVTAVDLAEDARASDAGKGDESAAVRTFRADVTAVGPQERIVALLRRLQERRPRVWMSSCRLELVDRERERVELRGAFAIHMIPRPDRLQNAGSGARNSDPGPCAIAVGPAMWNRGP